MPLPFDTQSTGGSGDNGYIGPIGRPGFEQGGAPGGLVPGADLPVKHSPSPFREGFTPEPTNPPCPTDPMDGYTKPPAGGRR